MTKIEIRQRIQHLFKIQLQLERESLSKIISLNVIKNKYFKKANAIFGFLNLPTEPATEPIIKKALNLNKMVFVPRIAAESLVFTQFRKTLAFFPKNKYGIIEPPADWPQFPQELKPGSLILILVPGMAFDRQKNRLGRGKGFYDRFLRSLEQDWPEYKFIKAGLCFDFQIFQNIPVEFNDVKMDLVISEKEVIN